MRIDTLLRIMAMLRDPDHGCPWDLRQDFRSIAPHTLEETYEVIDAIESGDYAHLKNELGDLLFQVVFYAQLGREAELFDFDDIVDEIAAKLLYRHPHVFPAGTIDSFGTTDRLTADQVEANWERLKRQERDQGSRPEQEAEQSLLDDVPLALPALSRARKLQKRAAGAGFDWSDSDGVMNKIDEELAELGEAMREGDEERIADELGDMFFTLVNLARHLKQDPERCLRGANRKFERRFRDLEARVRRDGRELHALTLAQLEQYWQSVKQGKGES